MCHYASEKKCADFSLKIHQKRLAAGLRLDPLGEVLALPDPHLDLRGRDKKRGNGKRQRWREERREEDRGRRKETGGSEKGRQGEEKAGRRKGERADGRGGIRENVTLTVISKSRRLYRRDHARSYEISRHHARSRYVTLRKDGEK